MRDAHRRGEDLGLTEEELAFYDALEVNDSAVKVLGDEALSGEGGATPPQASGSSILGQRRPRQ